jgi:Tfp pilus assembly protein PilF
VRLLLVFLLCAVGAGCTTAPFSASSPGPASRDPGRAEPAEPAPQSTASVALLEQSRAARGAGRYAEATASLERALRIDPNNPLLWIELAEVKAADGDRQQAREMARKALTLAGGDRAIEARAARLL